MTTELLGSPPAGGEPGAVAGARTRLFALLASTSFRVALQL
jgi:hypothetical protein